MSEATASEPVPHRTDHYAGARGRGGFWPYMLAPTADGCWALEGLGRVVVFIRDDPAELHGPFGLMQRDGSQNLVLGIATRDDRLCVAWSDRLTILDPEVGAEREVGVPAPPLAISSDPAGVWCLGGNGAVFRVDPLAGEAIPIGAMPRYGRHSTARHGAVFALGSVDGEPERCLLVALEQRNGGVRFQTPIEGLPMQLAADAESVWVYLWHNGGCVTGEMIEVDPYSGAVRDQAAWSPHGSFLPLPDGMAWLHGEDPAPAGGEAQNQGVEAAPAQLHPLALRPGSESRSFALPRPWRGPVASGPSVVWCPLDHGGTRTVEVAMIPLEGGAAHVHDLSGIDMSPYLPPPPGPVDAKATERQVRDDLERFVRGPIERSKRGEQPVALIRGVTFESVELYGDFPDTHAALIFRSEERPAVRYGRRRRLWHDDGTLEIDIEFDLLGVHLMEDFAYGLPAKDRDPSPDGIVWI